jgi:hypothetical protein
MEVRSRGKLLSGCVSLVAELAIADHLQDGPQDVGSLAATTGTKPDALYRVLRVAELLIKAPQRNDLHLWMGL